MALGILKKRTKRALRGVLEPKIQRNPPFDTIARGRRREEERNL
jgi:hypothetical protein